MNRDMECLRAIINFCDEAHQLIQKCGSDLSDFNENHSLQYSCAFIISQIGENVKCLSPELKEKNHGINWKAAMGMRDIIVHNYGMVNVNVLRDTILKDIPLLKSRCQHILLGLI